MPRKNLPPFVQRLKKAGRKDRFRAWAMLAGRRRFGPVRDDALEAHRDAIVMRGVADVPAWGGQFGTRAEEWLAAIGVRVAADTVAFYRSKLRLVWSIVPASIALDRITPAVLTEFVREATGKGRGARTVQHCRRTLHAFFAWCLRRGAVQTNPVDAIEWPRPQESMPDVLNEVELAAALAKITDHWAADLAVAIAYTGLRRAEVARLQVVDVDLAERVLWIRGKVRAQAHPIPDDAVDALQRLVAAAAGEFVIPGTTDRSRRSKIAETFRRWQRRLKDPRWHPHALRHSVATIMLRKGVAPPTVQRFLRHSSYAMTQRYVHLVEADLREATTRLRLVKGNEADAKHG